MNASWASRIAVSGNSPAKSGRISPCSIYPTRWLKRPGGKTVALRTVGLLALMFQSGLHIPCAPGSVMPIFDDILADIGDEQSVAQSLSTFSGHLRTITRIVATADEGTLVLLDELGAGTDPTEGSALAQSLLDHFIRAGSLGQIREIYQWGIGVTAKEGSAEGEDPLPEGFNWDLWVGPSAMRPFKKDVYHPFRWRGWFDFGNGGLADFCCHAINLPMRALDLGYPQKIVVNMQDGQQISDKAAVEFHFPARGELPPITLYWQGSGEPSAEVLQPLTDTYGEKVPNGVLIVGEKGCIHTSHWNTGGKIRLEDEPGLSDVLRHEATEDIPKTLPRNPNHGKEWLDACRGDGQVKTFSDFDIGGKLTEIGLAGVVGIRAGKSLDWDGENMKATNAPEAARFVHTEYRSKWLT